MVYNSQPTFKYKLKSLWRTVVPHWHGMPRMCCSAMKPGGMMSRATTAGECAWMAVKWREYRGSACSFKCIHFIIAVYHTDTGYDIEFLCNNTTFPFLVFVLFLFSSDARTDTVNWLCGLDWRIVQWLKNTKTWWYLLASYECRLFMRGLARPILNKEQLQVKLVSNNFGANLVQCIKHFSALWKEWRV